MKTSSLIWLQDHDVTEVVMAATRGPDNEDNELKNRTTAPLRTFIGYRYGAQSPCLHHLLDWVRDDYEKPGYTGHFATHIRHAVFDLASALSGYDCRLPYRRPGLEGVFASNIPLAGRLGDKESICVYREHIYDHAFEALLYLEGPEGMRRFFTSAQEGVQSEHISMLLKRCPESLTWLSGDMTTIPIKLVEYRRRP